MDYLKFEEIKAIREIVDKWADRVPRECDRDAVIKVAMERIGLAFQYLEHEFVTMPYVYDCIPGSAEEEQLVSPP
jgi:hypothetical protein